MSLLPPNASPLELAIESAIAVPALPVPLRDLWSPQACPETLLPWLAWGLSIDDWDPDWPAVTKREVVARAIEVQRLKGTLAAVRNAAAPFGAAISVREWWETDPEGPSGTFTLTLALSPSQGVPSPAQIDEVIRAVTRAKPLSRSFTFALALGATGAVGLFAAARPISYVRLDGAAAPLGATGAIGMILPAQTLTYVRLSGEAA